MSEEQPMQNSEPQPEPIKTAPNTGKSKLGRAGQSIKSKFLAANNFAKRSKGGVDSFLGSPATKIIITFLMIIASLFFFFQQLDIALYWIIPIGLVVGWLFASMFYSVESAFFGFAMVVVFIDFQFFKFDPQYPVLISRMVLYGTLVFFYILIFEDQKVATGTALELITYITSFIILQPYIGTLLQSINDLLSRSGFTIINPFIATLSTLILGLAPFIFILIIKKVNPNSQFDFTLLLLFFYQVFALSVVTKALELYGIPMSSATGFNISTLLYVALVILPWAWFMVFNQTIEKVPWQARMAVFLFTLSISILVISSTYSNQGFGQSQQSVLGPTEVVGQYFNDLSIALFGKPLTEAGGPLFNFTSFETRVERSAQNIDIGIQLEPIEPAYFPMKAGEEHTFTSQLTAKTLDSSTTIDIDCVAVPVSLRKLKQQTGILSPESAQVSSFISPLVDCTFDPVTNALIGGAYEIQLNASYPYVTSAYLRRYFVKESFLEAISQPGRPVENTFYLTQQIPKQKESIYTHGPVKLALDVGTEIIPVRDTQTTNFKLRMSVENDRMWGGNLRSINNVLISAPTGILIKQDGGSLDCSFANLKGEIKPLNPTECSQMNDPFTQLDCQNYNHYVFTAIGNQTIDTRQQSLIMSCSLEAISQSQVLNNGPYTAKSIRARVAYNYQASESTVVQIQDNPEFNPGLISGDFESKKFCGADFVYTTQPIPSLIFELQNDTEELVKVKEKVFERLEKDGDLDAKSQLEADACYVNSIAWGLIYRDWNQLQFGPNIGNSLFGYLRVTPQEIMAAQPQGNLLSQEELGKMTTDEFTTYASEHGTTYGLLLLEEARQACAASPNPLECTIGKFKCGRFFEYNDYASCTKVDCFTCHDTIIPQVVTIAVQAQ